jgi:taurine dioxygenase
MWSKDFTDLYKRITVKPIAGSLGAEIEGIDVSQKLDDETIKEISTAFTNHQVICIRDQTMNPETMTQFAELFGPLTKHPFIKTLPGSPYVAPIIRDADASGLNFGGQWHCDVAFLESPPLGSMLYAIEVPPYGGDTMFANLYLAYETLPQGMKDLADQLILVHSAAIGYDPDRGAKDPSKSLIGQKGMEFEVVDDPKKEMEHPLVQFHPVSGRKLLWVTGPYSLRFKDMTEEASKPLLDYFQSHVTQPAFTCRFRWQVNTLLWWDNRCAQHFAVNDYHGFRRVMHRVQIGGGKPVGPISQTASHSRT